MPPWGLNWHACKNKLRTRLWGQIHESRPVDKDVAERRCWDSPFKIAPTRAIRTTEERLALDLSLAFTPGRWRPDFDKHYVLSSGFTEFSGPVFPIFLVTFVSTDSHSAWLAEIQYCSSANMNKRGPNNGCYLGCYQTPKSKIVFKIQAYHLRNREWVRFPIVKKDFTVRRI
ncbi:uncharacterized protein CIMG_13716 [Coccidioides immitis RS]|uniref:Uncharacterized protein n=1 Tax=Coccidioides immitis (strain RS) TaxID=246410 RepID=J3KBH9_COCIM|nr:uncharacterized protein CIMG_13716 [Coccidioides immitis RS]EAS32475.3 hypothetical protein CIMG_13716 [Coccidioides immitis RS]